MGFYLKHKRSSDLRADGPEGWLIPYVYGAVHNCTLTCFVSVEVVTAAASCLKKILATDSGSNLVKKFGESKQEQLLWYLEPFRPSKKKRASLRLFRITKLK